MTTMQFKNFVFPHNPQSITISEPSRVSVHFCPGYGDVVRSMGRQAREVRCTGSFLAEDFEQATAILDNWKEATAGEYAGMLFLPGMQPFSAVLADCVFEARGDGRVIPYSMRFLECLPEVW